MEQTIGGKVARHEAQLVKRVLAPGAPAERILTHILTAKFSRSASPAVAAAVPLAPATVENLLRQIVQQKFEQRPPSGDIFDDFLLFLSGEQQSLMEISYTKQQQKQKQKQQNKNQDSDTMAVFDKKHQLSLAFDTPDYFAYVMGAGGAGGDLAKLALNMPLPFPILTLSYIDETSALPTASGDNVGGGGGRRRNTVHVYRRLSLFIHSFRNASCIT